MSRNSTTLWSPNDTVRDAAEVVGIQNLPDDVAKAMAMDVEYRLHEIIEQAKKFMRHSKRRTLSAQDVDSALKVLRIEPLYGYDTARAAKFREAIVGTGQTLYYVDEEEEVDFDKLIGEPIPKVPREPTYTAHWLAVEGVQPAIPQNPHIGEVRQLAPAVRGSQVTYSTAKLSQEADVKPLVKHMISKELQLYFDRIVAALLGGSASSAQNEKSHDAQPAQNGANGSQKDAQNGVSTEASSTHRSEGDATSEDYETALYSLRNDPGLHQLTPYFIQFVQEKVSAELKGPPALLITMLDVLDALLSNPTIFVGPYIHQLVPAVLTVLVAKRITGGGYAARDRAASLLRRIVSEFGSQYTALRPRLTRTLLKGFMDIQRPLESHYGIVQGIHALGPEVVLVIIVGNLSAWLDPVATRGQQEDSREAWSHLKRALADALADAPQQEAKEAIELMKTQT